MGARRAITDDILGAWLFKASPGGLPLAEVLRSGFSTVTTRCIRPSYRTDLVRAGQPVLLWVSGRDPVHPAGVYACGSTTGPTAYDVSEPFVPVRLRAVEPAVPRTELLADPVLALAEVIRMPAGSNPSYLDVQQYAALCAAFPQVGSPQSTA